jgi:hypothetical protein
MKKIFGILFTLALVLGVSLVAVPATPVAANSPGTFILPGGSLTTTNTNSWGQTSYSYPVHFDVDAGPVTIEYLGVSAYAINYTGDFGWPPDSTDTGASVIMGLQGGANLVQYSFKSNMAGGACKPGGNCSDWGGCCFWTEGKGSWNNQTAHYWNDDGYRSYLFQGQYTGNMVKTVGNSEYNAEKHGGPSGNDSDYDTFDFKFYVEKVGPNAYNVTGWHNLWLSSAIDEGCGWDWNEAKNAHTPVGYQKCFEGTWTADGGLDLSDVQVFLAIQNWAGTQPGPHTFDWDSVVVTGTIVPPDEVWVDDGYYDGGANDGHIWGYDAFNKVQDGIDAVAGSTVHVAAGTYNESIFIQKPLSVLGAGANQTFIDQSGNSSAGTVVTIKNLNGDVTFNGFTVKTGPASTVDSNGIYVGGSGLTGGTITISDNVIQCWQSANGTVKDNFGLIAGYFTSTTPKLVFARNTVYGGGSNPVLIEKWAGPTEITNNYFNNGIKNDEASDVIFMMNYGGTANNQKQLISGNTFDMGWGATYDNDHRGAGVSIASSYTGGTAAGGFTNVTISNNTFVNLKPYRRGILLWNNSDNGDGGNLANVVIQGNTISNAVGYTGQFGIRILGKATVTTITQNAISGVDKAISIEPYKGYEATGTVIHYNSLLGGTYGLNNAVSAIVDASGNWWGGTDPTTVAGMISGAVDFTPLLDSGADTDPVTPGFQPSLSSLTVHTLGSQTGSTERIQEGVNLVSGSTVNVAAGTYGITSMIAIDKSVTIVGDPVNKPVVQANSHFDGDLHPGTTYYMLRGVYGVTATINIQNLVLDGNGYDIYGGMRFNDTHSGTIENCVFRHIRELTFVNYTGIGIVSDGAMTIRNNVFTDIGRVGIWVGTSSNTISNNVYTGKGVGDWLDYGIEVGDGGVATITGNTITNCLGVASSDGSESAAILVTTYYGAGTTATITCNTLTGNTGGIGVGYDDEDTSTVVAHYNNIYGNTDYGIDTTAPVVDARYNWWGDASGPGTVGPGTGDKVSNNVLFDPWLHVESVCPEITCETTGTFTSQRHQPEGTWSYDISITRTEDGEFVSGTIKLTAPNTTEVVAVIKAVKCNYAYWYNNPTVSKPNFAAVGTATYGAWTGNFMFLIADNMIQMVLSTDDYSAIWAAETPYPWGARAYDIFGTGSGFWVDCLCPVTTCVAIALDFSICEGTTVNDQLFIDNGATCSEGCNLTLTYSFDGSTAGIYSYNATCDNRVCDNGVCTPDVKTGTVTVVAPCVATAPSFSIHKGTTVNDQLFIDNGATCSEGCNLILTYSFDGSTAGIYSYNATCDNGVCTPDVKTGTVTVGVPCETTGTFTSQRHQPGTWNYDISITRTEDGKFVSGSIDLTAPNTTEVVAVVKAVKCNYAYWYNNPLVSKPNFAAVGTATYGAWTGNFMFLIADNMIQMMLSTDDYSAIWAAETPYPWGDRAYDIFGTGSGFWVDCLCP